MNAQQHRPPAMNDGPTFGVGYTPPEITPTSAPVIDVNAVRNWLAAVLSNLTHVINRVDAVLEECHENPDGPLAEACGNWWHLKDAASRMQDAADELGCLDGELATRADATGRDIPALTAERG